MPYFFQYDQEDLTSFCEAVCAAAPIPCWLYNLPSFTAGIRVENAIGMLRDIPNLVGMKDSSGNRDHLEILGRERARGEASIFVGDDSLLLDALRAGWSGVVSGIACFVPELIRAVYDAHVSGDAERAARWQQSLDELIEQVVRMPIPWGVRTGLEARGIPNGPMHVPPSAHRARQAEEFRTWMAAWAEQLGLKLQEVWSSLG
jgi:4-hydroxy-tetrahydrodipicolinate synthase